MFKFLKSHAQGYHTSGPRKACRLAAGHDNEMFIFGERYGVLQVLIEC